MKCPKCGYPVLPKYKVCPHCGMRLNQEISRAESKSNVAQPLACPKCGNTNIKEGQKFCTKCGAPLSALWQNGNDGGQAKGGEQKGIIDNITHLGTFIQRGSQGVQRAVQREREERIRREAEAAGLEVSKPQHNDEQQPQPQAQAQPQQRRPMVDTSSVAGVSIVQGRAIWNIQRGQIARRITEAEFANVDGLKGVIVQEGCTAMVYIDGQLMSVMQAGVYTFPSKTEADIQLEQRQRELNQQQEEIEKQERALREEQRKKDDEYARSFRARGVFGEIAAFGRGITNFLFGKKKDESLQQHKERVERTVQKLKKNPAPKICRVYLVSNRVLNLILATKTTADGDIDYEPMTIPTKLVDIQIGVSMLLQITNLSVFATNHLADQGSVSLLDMAKLITPSVKSLLTQMLRNLDYQQDGLPEPVVENLKNRIRAKVNEQLQGIEVTKVLDVTDRSADFDRFRSVEHQLFATDKELSFLQRTGEFRNRLEQEQNRQTVNSATNAEHLRQALQAINKDKLLSEDEMEQFVMLLESQKRLRQAKTKEEEYEALSDLKKSQLVKDDELAALQNTLAQGKLTRENATEIMRIQAEQKADMERQIAAFALSDNKQEHDMAVELRQAEHDGKLAEAAIIRQRMEDAYKDERRQKDDDYDFSQRQRNDDYDFSQRQRDDDFDFNHDERQRNADNNQTLFDEQLRQQKEKIAHEQQRQDKFDDMSILERKAAIAKQNMQAMQEAELAKQKEQNRSAEALHSMDVDEHVNRDNQFANMSAEQIQAAQLSHISEAAQVAMAQSYSSDKENELRTKQQEEQKALYEQMMKTQQSQNQQNQEMMMKMAEMMQQGMMGVGQQQMASQQAMFGQQKAMQQQRYDDQVAMKNEYRDNALHQQSRMDHTQDSALGSMGQVTTAAAGNINAYNGGYQSQKVQADNASQKASQQQHQRHCPSCGAEVPDGEMFCPECGQKM